MIRRSVALAAACAACAVAAAPASGGTATYTRTVRTPYKGTGGVPQFQGATYLNGEVFGAVQIATRKGEYALSIVLADEHSPAVLAEAAQDVDGDGTFDESLGTFCGSTAKPLPVRRQGAPVMVYLVTGACDTSPSVPTTGTMTAKLYRRTRR